jgi:hypothetical protein
MRNWSSNSRNIVFTLLVCLFPVVVEIVGVVGTNSLAWEFIPGVASICPDVVDLMMMMQAVVVVVMVVVLLHRRLLHQASARALEWSRVVIVEPLVRHPLSQDLLSDAVAFDHLW